ncbi:hypothetical protein Lal_00023211 [Lupinus albus]|uniref:Putative nepenthesin n=1 Tax=Lupinus albus TaxID=3870 RepID=A0A6A4NIB0_LUPAL|nr:putative nepenthesin [Lupinus albus]KAF1881176.1 hypothetical protein Lal_00023211 [Lupinus albus]
MKGFVLLTIILFQVSISSSSLEANNGLSVDLIHRNSPLSPFYNPSLNHSEYIINAAFHSIARAKSFIFIPPHQNKPDHTIVTESRGDYLMQMFIGTPPKKIIVVADTGSDLTWVQCFPCKDCYFQNFPLFDPFKSNTHHLIPCNTIPCDYLYIRSCGKAGECIYGEEYGDKSYTRGTLRTETVSFNNTYIGRIIKYPNVIFGCGYHNYGDYSPNAQGIVGLGGGPLSLIRQIGDKFGKRKFSYCFLPYKSKRTSQIKFGVDTQKNRSGLFTTPLVQKFPSTYYYVSLERISVNGKTFTPKANETEGNFIIDSGTTITQLKSDLFYKLKAFIIESLGEEHKPERYPPKPFELCYRDGVVEYFPSVSFYFADADYGLHFSEGNVFGRFGPFTCLWMLPTNIGHSILGNYQQVFFNVEYDLDKNTVSFAPSNCK